jgi:hypothetical protein
MTLRFALLLVHNGKRSLYVYQDRLGTDTKGEGADSTQPFLF